MKRKYAEGGEVDEESGVKRFLPRYIKEGIKAYKKSMSPEVLEEGALGAVGKEFKKAKQGLDIMRGKKLESPDDIPPRNLQEAKDEMIRRKEEKAPTTKTEMGKMFKKGGKVSSASKRADGIAKKGKTRGKFV